MPLKYYLKSNPITPDPNDQSARIAVGTVHDMQGIIKLMLNRGSTVTEADIKAVITIFMDVVSDEVANGNAVNLPLFNLRPSINGVFINAADSFDVSRHTKRASISSGVLLTEKMHGAKVEKVLQPLAAPMLVQFTDINSQTTNSLLTPGGIGQLVGEELKFNPSNPEEGVFLIGDGGVTVKAEVVASRTDKKVVFSIPNAMNTGMYSLEVRKGYGSTTITVRSGRLLELLKVV
jgi:hypothetical protein